MEQKKQRQGKEFWAGHIKRWESSGTSRRQYCIAERISYWAFREGQKRLSKETTSGRDLVELPHEVYHSVEKIEAAIELSSPGNITLRIRKGFDRELLRALLHEFGVRL